MVKSVRVEWMTLSVIPLLCWAGLYTHRSYASEALTLDARSGGGGGPGATLDDERSHFHLLHGCGSACVCRVPTDVLQNLTHGFAVSLGILVYSTWSWMRFLSRF